MLAKTFNSLFQNKDFALTPEDFANLYEAHLDAVFNYCLFRTDNQHLAEDITADTFERVWQNRHHYDPGQANFTTWLFTIARNRIIDAWRKDARQKQVVLDEQQPDGKPPVESLVEYIEQSDRLQAVVQNLTEQEKELIALKFGAGLTNRYIAEILNKSETAVGSAIHRLMGKLRQQWERTNVKEINV